MSKTISITIPDQLEGVLQKEADTIGISRSRHIGNILLDRQSKSDPINDCGHLSVNSTCSKHGHHCAADQANAETCEGYIK